VYLEKSGFEFSFAGLKSAVSREIERRAFLPFDKGEMPEGQRGWEDAKEISYEFQRAVNEVLCYKIMSAAAQK